MKYVVVLDPLRGVHKVAVKKPGLKFLQKGVDGYVELVKFHNGFTGVVNEEGALRNYPTQVVGGRLIYGTVVIVKETADDLRSLTEVECEHAMTAFK